MLGRLQAFYTQLNDLKQKMKTGMHSSDTFTE
uniref:Uncharacterized protein n=1 Tax=Anguilla anguilla TaxID=7936 RepID=A0A0E9UTN2_ANGAN